MKKILATLFIFLFILNSIAFAEEAVKGNLVEEEAVEEEAGEIQIYHFPEVKPEFYGFFGYRFFSITGSEQAGEFEYPHSSLVAGTEIRLLPFPHRIHIEADMLSAKDYFIDARYSYKDIIMIREVNRTLFHNLDNITLIDLNTATANPGVSVLDAGEKYGIKTGINSLFLRLKTPHFPLHLYLDGGFVNKNGDMQQRFMGGSGYFNNIVRVSQKRDIEWDTKDITVGINSHLGPVEVDVSHTEKTFDSGGDSILSYNYAAAGFPPGSRRPAGTFPHNLIPDLKSSTNTIKLHTSYTGRLVASATLSKTEKDNLDSGAEADYLNGNIEIAYIPDKKLMFVARYRHKESDIDNPSSLPAGYLGYSAYTAPITGIRPSISSQTDTFSGIARYKPFRGLSLTAEYSVKKTERDDAEAWELPEDTTQKNLILSANIRPLKNLTFKAKYGHQETDNPAYNNQPDRSDQGSISMSWVPFSWASTLLSYSITKEKRDDIFYANLDTVPATPEPENREALRDRFLGSITFMLMKQLTLTASYAYFHNKTEQDLIYNSPTGLDQLDKDVPYKEFAHNYVVNLNYQPIKNLNIDAAASQTVGKGRFSPGIAAAQQPVNIASFSELKIRETEYSIGGDYKFKKDWAVGMNFRYANRKDMIDNIYDDENNGTVRVLLVTISKKW